MKKFLEMPLVSRITIVIAIALVVLVIFWAGMAAGYAQAQYSYRWGNHYAENFGGPRSPFFTMRADPDSVHNANGAAGIVQSVNLPTVVVKGPNEAEKIVLIDSHTAIRRLRGEATSTDIHVGDMMIAIGAPDENGRIVASFVRLMSTSTPR